MFMTRYAMKRFVRLLKHTNFGQTKFIKRTHKDKDIKSSKVQVSDRSTESKVDFNCRVDLVKLRIKRGFKAVKIRCNERKLYKYTK